MVHSWHTLEIMFGHDHHLRHRVAMLGLLAGALSVVATGCSATVAGIEVAEDATNPECAEAMVALPDEVAGQERRRTDSQSTAAWGDPATVIFRCGVPVPGPTTEHCVEANGVDWITQEEDQAWRLTTYGRDPAMEVVFTADAVASSSVMVDLADAVSRVESFGQCTTSDVETVEPIPETSPLEQQ